MNTSESPKFNTHPIKYNNLVLNNYNANNNISDIASPNFGSIKINNNNIFNTSPNDNNS